MKQIATSLILIACFATAMTAQVPNGGFELWNGNEPDQWSTNNSLANLSGSEACLPMTSAPEGNLYMQLNSYFEPALGMPTSAYAVCGTYDFLGGGTTINGFPYGLRPDYLTGMYKYQASSDMGAVVTYMTKWNTTTNSRDTVGSGQLIFNPIGDWTNFNVLINYTLPQFPDSCVLAFISSINYPAELGATLSIDALDLSNTPASTSELNESAWNIFPNPAEDFLNICCPSSFGSYLNVSVIDATGRVVLQQSVTTGIQSRIALDKITPGVYTLFVQSNNQRHAKSFVKK